MKGRLDVSVYAETIKSPHCSKVITLWLIIVLRGNFRYYKLLNSIYYIKLHTLININ